MRTDYPLGRNLSGFIRARAGQMKRPEAATLVRGWLRHCRFQSHFSLSCQAEARGELEKISSLPNLPPALELEYLFDTCNLANQFSLWDLMTPALDKLERISNDLGYTRGLAQTEYFRAALLINDGNYRAAGDHYRRALELARGEGQDDLRAEILNDIGFCHRRLSDNHKALKHYRDSLEIRERTGNLPGQAESLNNIGLVLCSQERFGEAEEALGRAMKIEETIGDKMGAGYTLLNLSHLASRKGEHYRAEELCRRALAVRREIGDQLGLGYCYINLAYWAKARDDREKALSLLDSAIESFSIVGESYSLTETRLKKVQYLLGFGIIAKARQEMDGLGPSMTENTAKKHLESFKELQESLAKMLVVR